MSTRRSNASPGSSRQKARASRMASRATTAVWSPRKSWVSSTRPPRRARSRARIACPSTGIRLSSRGATLEALGPRRELVLELHQAVDDALGAGWASRDVHVDGDDRVDSLNRRVVVVEAARAGADAEGHHPLGLAHLVIDPLEHWRHLVADGAHHEQHVGLTRRE